MSRFPSVRALLSLSLATLLSVGACARPSSRSSGSMTAPSPDPRIGLRSGWFDAAEASWNMRLVSNTPPSDSFINRSTPGVFSLLNSDITFTGNYAIQGNFSGWQVWDISNPRAPWLKKAFVCPGSQSDVSVQGNLLFVSGEATSGRLDCGLQGVADSVSHERLRGIRIFDITDIANPRYLANVQTCRGSHTHTVVTDPNDANNIYIYISGSAPVRSPNELAGCSNLAPDQDPNSARFRIEVIRVPLSAPEQARIVSTPRIFNDLTAPPTHGEPGEPPRPANPARSGPEQCHDITVYPAIGLAGGACRGYGLLLDIRDPANPRRVAAVADSNFSAWHSATFNNDGTKILFSDEWGGGLAPRCRPSDKMEWGADAIFDLRNNALTFRSYFKMPAPQTANENCVSHNGTLIPIPGRDIMVQGWYQGGISVFEWTDAAHPREIAYFDRGPMDSTKLVSAGSWSAYWYNGYIFSSDLARGLDILELLPSGLLSQNELDAAKSIRFDYLNAQGQPQLVWPASFAVPRAYLDQLERGNGLSANRIATVRDDLRRAERMSAAARRDAMMRLSAQLHSDAPGAADQARMHALATSVEKLASAAR